MGNELSKNYADKAMFTAEPVETKVPKVYLVNASPDPLGSIAAMNLMYTGRVIRNLEEITDEDRLKHWEDVQKTVLAAPLESVQLHFLIEGVTRGFTHQLVRQRTAVYAQESMRFAVKENATQEVAYPPSLIGVERTDDGPVFDPAQMALDEWDDLMDTIGRGYNRLIELGMPAEDARGVLPTNIQTRIHYVTNLRALVDHSGKRLCTQAQFEWRMMWLGIESGMVNAIRNYSSCQGHVTADESAACRICDNWQWKLLSTIFQPICYSTGKCEFMSQIDRHCSIRDRVNANHEIGRPSSEWDQTYDNRKYDEENLSVAGFNPNTSVVRGPSNDVTFIGPIKRAEWAADPSAARVKK